MNDSNLIDYSILLRPSVTHIPEGYSEMTARYLNRSNVRAIAPGEKALGSERGIPLAVFPLDTIPWPIRDAGVVRRKQTGRAEVTNVAKKKIANL